jgi:protein-S-isoprenylcysteine O-methyltransferase Ste14
MPLLVVRALIFVVVLPGAVLVYIPNRILAANPGLPSFHLGWLRLTGWVPIALGLAVLTWCWVGFVVEGRGTPAPYDPPRRLVTGQLYRWVRNPMYVALVIVLLGESVAFQSLALLVYAGVVWLACHLFVVLYEEPALHRRFGAAYDSYRGQVPRWLPRLRRSGSAGVTDAAPRQPPEGQT